VQRLNEVFILTTEEGDALRNTDGFPIICNSQEEVRFTAPFLEKWFPLEVSEREASFLANQALMAFYGWRFGLTV